MARVIDITEKLNHDEPPRIRIGTQEVAVRADAATMLKIMGVLSGDEETGAKEILTMYRLLFDEKDREKIESLNLRFSDFRMLIETAIGCVTGEGDEGETATRTMT